MAVNNSTGPEQCLFIEPLKDVIEQAKRGDQQAMHRLYMLYAKAMLNTAFRILNHPEDAEDVLQEAFIKVFSRLNQYNYQSTFGAWVKRIVINKSIDALKKKRQNVFLAEDFATGEEMEPAFSSEGTDDPGKKLDLLYKALHSLPDGYRTVFSLYMLEGYDHNEISEILKIEVSTSISQLSRAKKKIISLTQNFQHHG